MANEYLGETPITLGGVTYTLCLTMNRQAHLERELDCRGQLHTRLMSAGADTMRAAIHACLTVPFKKGMRPAIRPPFTLADMGDLLDEAGGIPAISEPYWEMLVCNGFADRGWAELAGLIPTRKGPKDGAVENPAPPVEEPLPLATI